MPGQTWRQTLTTQQAAGTLLNTYTTAKSVINPQALFTLPAGFWSYIGQEIEVCVTGGISTLVTTPGTVTFQIMHGSIVVWTSGAIQLNATAHTTLPFYLQVPLTVQVLGSGTSAKLMGVGFLTWCHVYAHGGSNRCGERARIIHGACDGSCSGHWL